LPVRLRGLRRAPTPERHGRQRPHRLLRHPPPTPPRLDGPRRLRRGVPRPRHRPQRHPSYRTQAPLLTTRPGGRDGCVARAGVAPPRPPQARARLQLFGGTPQLAVARVAEDAGAAAPPPPAPAPPLTPSPAPPRPPPRSPDAPSADPPR